MTEVSIEMNVAGGSSENESQNPFLEEEEGETQNNAQNKLPITMNVCEAQTKAKYFRTSNGKCTKYKFKYSNTPLGETYNEISKNQPDVNGEISKHECIRSWQELKKLEVDREWDIIRHPYTLHFVNQKLLGFAGLYTVYIIAFVVQFVSFALHIISPNKVTLCIVVFLSYVLYHFLVREVWEVFRNRKNENVLIEILRSFPLQLTNILIGFSLITEDPEPVFPILAIAGIWLNLLYVLRMSPVGIYILMMTRIFRSLLYIVSIWIPTLITCSFMFIEAMRDTDVEPWSLVSDNKTISQNAMYYYQSVVKISTMMIGEVDANDVLKSKKFIPTSILLLFNVTAVIVFMNLMISVAVGDVNDLKKEAEDLLLQIKLRYVIKAFRAFEISIIKKEPWNGLVVFDDGRYLLSHVDFENTPFDEMSTTEEDTWWMKYSKWLIGLDMAAFLKNQCLPAPRRQRGCGCYRRGRRAGQRMCYRRKLGK